MKGIVFTGIGIVSPLGIGREIFWGNCRKAQHGFRQIKTFDTAGMKSDVAALIDGFKPGDYLPAAAYRRMSHIARMAVAASQGALSDSGLRLDAIDRDRVGIVMGTAYGSSSHLDEFYRSFLKDGPRGAQPFLFPETVQNAAAGYMAIHHKITGPNVTFCQNEISAENALVYAANLLNQDLADTVLVGGADEVSQTLFQCYNAVGALNPIKFQEGAPIRPGLRGGHILAEGAGVLVMERRAYALQRGARIYASLGSIVSRGGATVIGHYGADSRALGRTMEQALEQAGLRPEEIDQVDLSANFSGELEQMEYEQVTRLFAKQKPPAVTPLKYLTGESSSSNIFRVAAGLLSLKEQMRLPALDAEILIDEGEQDLAWNPSEPGPVRNVLMTSATFGGGNVAMVLEKE